MLTPICKTRNTWREPYLSLLTSDNLTNSIPVGCVHLNPAINFVVVKLHFSRRLGLDEMLQVTFDAVRACALKNVP